MRKLLQKHDVNIANVEAAGLVWYKCCLVLCFLNVTVKGFLYIWVGFDSFRDFFLKDFTFLGGFAKLWSIRNFTFRFLDGMARNWKFQLKTEKKKYIPVICAAINRHEESLNVKIETGLELNHLKPEVLFCS